MSEQRSAVEERTSRQPNDRCGPTIVLANAWHDDNKGDSAITLVSLDLFRRAYPDARVRIASLLHPDDPACARACRNVVLLRPDVAICPPACPPLRPAATRWRRVAALAAWTAGVAAAYVRTARGKRPPGCLDGADLVVLQGGSNVFDSGRGVVGGFVRLAQVLFPAWAAQRASVPTVFLGHTLGPLPHGPARMLVGHVLRHSRLVVLREEASLRLAQRLRVPAAVLRTSPDLGFALAPAETSLVDGILVRNGLRNQTFAALVVRRHPYRDEAAASDMIRTLARTARRLLDGGVVEQVAVVAHTLGPTPVEDDRDLSHRLAESIGRGVPVIECDLTPPELAAFYGHAEVVVSVRLHGAVLALAAGTPAFAISYFTAKTDGVMSHLGLGDLVAPYGGLDEDRVVERVLTLVQPAARQRAGAIASRCRREVERAIADALVAGVPLPSVEGVA